MHEQYHVNEDMYNAVVEEDLYRIERYIHDGFDINENYKESKRHTGYDRCNLLFYAVLRLKSEAVEYLLKVGADVNTTTTHGRVPLRFIVSVRFIPSPKWLRYTEEFEKIGNPIDIALMLLEAGAYINTKEPHLIESPLELAVHSPAMVQLLLDYGADIYRTFHGQTSLLLQAADAGGMEVVRLLIDAGVDPEYR